MGMPQHERVRFMGRTEPLRRTEILSEEEIHQELWEILKGQPRITVGFIPDGNRRWARGKFGLLAPVAHRLGHNKGTEKVIGIVRHFREELPPMNLMPWGFSTDNWNRPQDEIEALFPLLTDTVELITKEAMEVDGRVIHMGRKDPLYDQDGNLIVPGLPEPLRTTLSLAEELTQGNKGAIIAPAINYSGRDELIRIHEKYQHAKEIGELLKDAPFTPNIWFRYGDDGGALGELTVLIRTSGEYRSSAFGWRADYAEFRVIDNHLPDITTLDIELKILNSLKPKRRVGK